MPTLSIRQSADYILHITAEPLDVPRNSVLINIESQWLGAENPDGRQVRYATILDREQARRLAFTIEKAANHQG